MEHNYQIKEDFIVVPDEEIGYHQWTMSFLSIIIEKPEDEHIIK